MQVCIVFGQNLITFERESENSNFYWILIKVEGSLIFVTFWLYNTGPDQQILVPCTFSHLQPRMFLVYCQLCTKQILPKLARNTGAMTKISKKPASAFFFLIFCSSVIDRPHCIFSKFLIPTWKFKIILEKIYIDWTQPCCKCCIQIHYPGPSEPGEQLPPYQCSVFEY